MQERTPSLRNLRNRQGSGSAGRYVRPFDPEPIEVVDRMSAKYALGRTRRVPMRSPNMNRGGGIP